MSQNNVIKRLRLCLHVGGMKLVPRWRIFIPSKMCKQHKSYDHRGTNSSWDEILLHRRYWKL